MREASSLGFEFENILMMATESGMMNIFQDDDHPPLEDHPLLAALDPPLPPHFRGQWRMQKVHLSYRGRTIGQVESEHCSLADWVVHPTSTFFLPDHYAGPDLVFYAINDYNKRALVLLQAKLINHNLDRTKSELAESKTDPHSLYMNSNGEVIRTRGKQRQAIFIEYYYCLCSK